MTRCVGFAPVARRDARVLILGSLPGAESLKQTRYYALKHNAFWPLMGRLLNFSADAPYLFRLAQLRSQGVALWDVCAAANRVGSLDAKITAQSIVPNDIGAFLRTHSKIKLICFNGQFAAKIFQRAVISQLSPEAAAIPRHVLPSTSPAHASLNLNEKTSVWRQVLAPHFVPVD